MSSGLAPGSFTNALRTKSTSPASRDSGHLRRNGDGEAFMLRKRISVCVRFLRDRLGFGRGLGGLGGAESSVLSVDDDVADKNRTEMLKGSRTWGRETCASRGLWADE